MDRTKKIILIVLLVLIAALLVVGVVIKLRGGEESKEVAAPPSGESAAAQKTAEAPPALVATENDEALYVRQLAEVFVERFGTYSTHAPGRNTEEVKPLLSKEGERWIARFAPSSLDAGAATAYQGITTNVASSELKEWIPDVRALVRVKTTRLTTTSSGESKTLLEDADVALRAVGGEWKVDRVEWVQ